MEAGRGSPGGQRRNDGKCDPEPRPGGPDWPDVVRPRVRGFRGAFPPVTGIIAGSAGDAARRPVTRMPGDSARRARRQDRIMKSRRDQSIVALTSPRLSESPRQPEKYRLRLRRSAARDLRSDAARRGHCRKLYSSKNRSDRVDGHGRADYSRVCTDPRSSAALEASSAAIPPPEWAEKRHALYKSPAGYDSPTSGAKGWHPPESNARPIVAVAGRKRPRGQGLFQYHVSGATGIPILPVLLEPVRPGGVGLRTSQHHAGLRQHQRVRRTKRASNIWAF